MYICYNIILISAVVTVTALIGGIWMHFLLWCDLLMCFSHFNHMHETVSVLHDLGLFCLTYVWKKYSVYLILGYFVCFYTYITVYWTNTTAFTKWLISFKCKTVPKPSGLVYLCVREKGLPQSLLYKSIWNKWSKLVWLMVLLVPTSMTRTQIWTSHSNDPTLLFLTQSWGSGKDARWGSDVRQLQWHKAGMQLNCVHTPPDTSVCSRTTCRQFPLWLSCLLPVSPWEQRAVCSAPSSPSALFLSLCPRRPFFSFGKTTWFSDLETVADLAGCSESQRARLCVSLSRGAKRGVDDRAVRTSVSELWWFRWTFKLIWPCYSEDTLWMLWTFFSSCTWPVLCMILTVSVFFSVAETTTQPFFWSVNYL